MSKKTKNALDTSVKAGAGVATNEVADNENSQMNSNENSNENSQMNSNENSNENSNKKARGDGVKFAFDFCACMNAEIIGEDARKNLLDISKSENPETFGLKGDYKKHQTAAVLRYARRFKAAEVLLDSFDKMSEFALNKAGTEQGKITTQERLNVYKELLSDIVAVDLQKKCDEIAMLVILNENLMGKASERAGGLKARAEKAEAELAHYKALYEAGLKKQA